MEIKASTNVWPQMKHFVTLRQLSARENVPVNSAVIYWLCKVINNNNDLFESICFQF